MGPFSCTALATASGWTGMNTLTSCRGDATILEEGMTFSIEPGIYLAGKYGVRIEDIVGGNGERARSG